MREVHGRQDGFSLVGVMVIVAMLGVFITIFMSSANQSRMIKKRVAASMTPQDVEDIMKADAVKSAQTYLKAGCLGAPVLSRSLGSAGTEQITRSIPLPAYASDEHKAAARRCASAPLLRYVGGGHAVYLCIRIAKATGAAVSQDSVALASSLLDSDYLFAEFYIRPSLPSTGASVSCQAIAAGAYPPNTGLELTYSLYWSVKDGKDHLAKQRAAFMLTRMN
jgi:hypothetical protein